MFETFVIYSYLIVNHIIVMNKVDFVTFTYVIKLKCGSVWVFLLIFFYILLFDIGVLFPTLIY